MTYSIKQLAQKIGTTVRTLQYYDNINLLVPDRNTNNGYRYYSENHLSRLRQIQYFKSLGFSLEEIANILDNPKHDEIKALKEQKQLLLLEQDNLYEIINEIDQRITQLKGGVTNMSRTQPVSDEINQYKEEARKRWGNTDAYKQSQQRTSQWTKDDWDSIKQESENILSQLATLSDKEVTNTQVQELIASYHRHMNNFYDCSYEMFQNLGNMYAEDERFGKYYQERGIEPMFIRDAIAYYCKTHQHE
ncbi:MerR family transcriptional regulator [candidate division WWE3 bacterium]|uniref:MerR family transcriptional regulator n=1 Tax=candidate division WWE3 bacterium TaxID=2053526 RepID=A0A955RX82_UNCKA|nr:MerR family transcriptional regulator [candidate division WWE3 bacterium]